MKHSQTNGHNNTVKDNTMSKASDARAKFEKDFKSGKMKVNAGEIISPGKLVAKGVAKVVAKIATKDSAKKALTKAALAKLKSTSTRGSDIIAKNSVRLQPKVGHPFYQEERRINGNRAASKLLLERKSGKLAKDLAAKLNADHAVSAKPKVIKIK